MIKQLVSILLSALVVVSASSVPARSQSRSPRVQRVTVRVTESGYRPASLRLRKGILAKATFIRKADATCGQVLVMPDYGIHRDLPVDQPVTITFIPRKSGTFSFTCGMNMLRGNIVVR